MTASAFIFVVGVTLIAYLYLKHRIAVELQPFRLEMAAMGERLLAEPELSERDARLLETQLSVAYSGIGPWIFVVMTPFAAIRTAYLILTGARKPADSSPHRLVRELNIVERRALISMMANSPVAAVIYVSELIVLMLLMIPLGVLRIETIRLLDRSAKAVQHSRHVAGH
jgi:hypothetical protein